MKYSPMQLTIAIITLAIASVASAQTVDQLTPHNVKVEQVEYKGKRAIKIVEAGDVANGEAYAIVRGATFHNGEIDVELAGQPAGGAAAAARGFIGIAFRMKDGQFEYIYLRPINGRADDQVRRNHSTQYSAVSERGGRGCDTAYSDCDRHEASHFHVSRQP